MPCLLLEIMKCDCVYFLGLKPIMYKKTNTFFQGRKMSALPCIHSNTQTPLTHSNSLEHITPGFHLSACVLHCYTGSEKGHLKCGSSLKY